MKIHPFAQVVGFVWFFGTAACFACGSGGPIAVCGIVTVLVGFGYMIAKY